MQPFVELFGRLHPMVLHAPIGLLIGLLVLEAVCAARRTPVPRAVRSTLAWLTAAAAAVSAATGFVLSYEAGYDAEIVQVHQWLGIGVAAGCLVGALLQAAGRTLAYIVVLVAAVGASIPTGHFGNDLTRGPGFLTEPLRGTPDQATPPPAPTGPPTHFATVIAPIFDNRCVSCHNDKRRKGGLSLASGAAIMRGGKDGQVIVPGDVDASELIVRLELPLDDADHMPPDSKPQPTEQEIRTIADWIASGASFDSPADSVAAGESSDGAEAIDPNEPAAPDAAAVAELGRRLVHVGPVRAGSHLLAVDFAAIAPRLTEAEAVALLVPLAPQIADLSVARAHVGDRLVALAAEMPNLRRLNLTATDVSDAGLVPLAGHAKLEELVLTQTGITDASEATLGALPALTRLYLWKSGLGADAIARLRERGVPIDAGDAPPAEAAEVEAQVTLSSGASVPGQVAAPSSLTPVNTVCPVSGSPVDPEYAIVYKGRVIGFCCNHCPSQFWEAPEKFLSKLPP